jgi:hypothetical protein
VRKARDEKKRVKSALERGEPSDYLPGGEFRYGIERTFKDGIKVISEEAAPFPPQRISQPQLDRPRTPTALPNVRGPTSSSEPKEQAQLSPEEMLKKLQAIPQAEIMTVAVNVKPGQTEDLTLYEGDDLTSVVTSFAQKHGNLHSGLSQDEMFKLRNLISAQLLAKDY